MLSKQMAKSGISINKVWYLPAGVFLATWLFSWFGLTWVSLSPILRFMLITGGSALAAGLVYRLIQLQQSQKAEIQQLKRRTEQVNAQMAGVYKLSALYSQAKTETEMIDALLKLCIDLVGAQGASFVPLDDRNQPLAAQIRGELPLPALNAWIEYLASPTIRQRCQQCQSYAQLNTSCPLLKGPFTDVIGLFCLPLSSGNREWGVMNLYMPNLVQLDTDTEGFLKTLLQDTALALESRRLRQREYDAMQQMRLIQQRTDLSGLLTSLLENIQSAFSANLAQIELQVSRAQRRVVLGETDSNLETIVRQTNESILRTGESVQLQTTSTDPQNREPQYNLLAVPLLSRKTQVIGSLVVVTGPNLQNPAHQLSLLHAFAAQVELVVENAELLAHLEYHTIMQERTRLAREIHDGLAQTLGLLKLQSIQAINYLNKSDAEKLRSTLSLVHDTLSEAYQDIRSAIDGLRVNVDSQGSLEWIHTMLVEFEELAEIRTHLNMDGKPDDVPAEIQTQLIRIVQEALNNIRKHTRAKNIWLQSSLSSGDWWLEIRDDGTGFTAEDIPSTSQYGLLGMRERADLIGADFQIVSQPDQGTLLRLRFPAILLLDWSALGIKGASS